jgi:putative MATE family efflux protein
MENYNLTTQPIPGLIKQIAIPSSIGFLFNTLYNVVDTYFGGRISTESLAAMSLSFPVFFVVIALGAGISTGATALMANAIGAGNMHKVRYYAVQSISYCLVVSVFLTWLGLVFSPFLFSVLGAKGPYLNLALEYTNVIFYGSAFFLLNFVLNSILTAQGNTTTYRNLLIIGFFLNIILDPWFIYGGLGTPALGLAGVAWATVLIQILTSIYLFYKIANTNIFCQECLQMIRPKTAYYLEISKQGFPASLNMMTIALGIFIITFFISKYGPNAVAAYGVATRFDQLAFLPIVGLNIATLTLVGQNNGAKLYDRVREIIRLALKYAAYIISLGIIAVFIFAKQLISIFSQDSAVINIGTIYLKISVLAYLAYAILYISVSALQGLKRPYYAIWIGLYRQIIAPILIFWLMSSVLGFKLNGIWWGIVIINWSAAIITYIYLKHKLIKLKIP